MPLGPPGQKIRFKSTRGVDEQKDRPLARGFRRPCRLVGDGTREGIGHFRQSYEEPTCEALVAAGRTLQNGQSAYIAGMIEML